jgi:hypothetical protein
VVLHGRLWLRFAFTELTCKRPRATGRQYCDKQGASQHHHCLSVIKHECHHQRTPGYL